MSLTGDRIDALRDLIRRFEAKQPRDDHERVDIAHHVRLLRDELHELQGGAR